ncbi:hypothetical protein SUDANB132_01141 [Streptomyces sp. enrichment culture]
MVVGQVVVYRLENPAPAPSEWPRDRIPYPGLDAFGEDEAAAYFGREAQAAELTRRLHASATRPADRFLMLTGASGSGKSFGQALQRWLHRQGHQKVDVSYPDLGSGPGGAVEVRFGSGTRLIRVQMDRMSFNQWEAARAQFADGGSLGCPQTPVHGGPGFHGPRHGPARPDGRGGAMTREGQVRSVTQPLSKGSSRSSAPSRSKS